jgi:hypothetical protein
VAKKDKYEAELKITLVDIFLYNDEPMGPYTSLPQNHFIKCHQHTHTHTLSLSLSLCITIDNVLAMP